MKHLLLSLSLLVSATAFAGHKTIEFTLEDSEIYPGTTHDVIVTVPDNYDSSKPAALYVGLDGILCNAPAVIDSLSAKGIMPTTISVFLQPGLIRNDAGEIIRYNRSNEFDATDGRFATFLETEVLPAVCKLKVDGKSINISENPADRMIFGLSSGGIAAFVTSWSRPDLFGKIFSGCGTFVPMRGGNELQAIVRKSEPKPLRVFLQDGFSDTWNPLFGSWYEANRLLASALEFAGYDCKFDWAEGGHSVRRSTEIFADVMTWMWRDYPSEPKTRPTANNLLSELLVEGAGWTPANGNYPEKPVFGRAVYPDSAHVAYTVPGSNFLNQSILRNGKEMFSQRFYWLHNLANSNLKIGGMTFDGNGNLWVATDCGIQICDQNGRVRGIIEIPAGLDVEKTIIEIMPGSVSIGDRNGHFFSRKFNIKPAEKGVRPESQGQG